MSNACLSRRSDAVRGQLSYVSEELFVGTIEHGLSDDSRISWIVRGNLLGQRLSLSLLGVLCAAMGPELPLCSSEPCGISRTGFGVNPGPKLQLGLCLAHILDGTTQFIIETMKTNLQYHKVSVNVVVFEIKH